MKTAFFVETGQQNPVVNNFFRAADLCNGVTIRDGTGYEIIITWKKKPTLKKIEEAKKLLCKIFENFGFVVLNIRSKK